MIIMPFVYSELIIIIYLTMSDNDVKAIQSENAKLMARVKQLTEALEVSLSKGSKNAAEAKNDAYVKKLEQELLRAKNSPSPSAGSERLGSLQNVIREQQQEIKSLQTQVQILKKENEKVKFEKNVTSQMDSLFTLKAKYQALQKSYDELKSENKSMKLISNN